MIADAYCGPAPLPENIAAAWNFDPPLLLALVAAAWLMRAGPARAWWGIAALIVAFVSPLCALSAGLFSARAAHHLVIIFVAAPLLVDVLRQWKGVRSIPLTLALAAHVAVMWLWHLPAAYAALLRSDALYWLGQFAMLGTAMLLWHRLTDPRAAPTTVLLVVFGMTMQMGLLGALLTFSPDAFYAPHYLTTQIYGQVPLADQQLAGLLLWTASLPLTALASWGALRGILRSLAASEAA